MIAPRVSLLKPPVPAVGPAQREERIRAAAYRRAESRGFAPGQELDDWLAAEREVDAAPPPHDIPRPQSKRR